MQWGLQYTRAVFTCMYSLDLPASFYCSCLTCFIPRSGKTYPVVPSSSNTTISSTLKTAAALAICTNKAHSQKASLNLSSERNSLYDTLYTLLQYSSLVLRLRRASHCFVCVWGESGNKVRFIPVLQGKSLVPVTVRCQWWTQVGLYSQ